MSDNLFVGTVLIDLDNVDSTNNYAKSLLSKSKPYEGTAIFAHNQKHGRGQYGKTWESQQGKNLTFSIILYPNFLSPERIFFLNQAISLAIRDFVAGFVNETVNVKWPNDIYCGSQKIAGILIENLISDNSIKHTVIGIGINVNQTKFAKQSNDPTSLKKIVGKDFDLISLLKKTFVGLEQRYLQLKSEAYRQIEAEYVKHLFQLNELKEYQTSHGKIAGEIKGINPMGQLSIAVNGDIKHFSNNQVIYL